MNRNERRRAVKEAKRAVAAGLDPSNNDQYKMAELVGQIHSRLENAKRLGNVDAPVQYLLSKIDLTVKGMADVPIACGKGCSHCCNIWVSATAPEALYIAKRLSAEAIERVSVAHEATKVFSHAERPFHPYPCPMLVDDLCTVYAERPLFCRLAASGDAEICRRSYHNITDEQIPTPVMYLFGRETYSTALMVALAGSGLPHVCYEFNGALQRCLTTPDAESKWLGGEDIFAGVARDTLDDALDSPPNKMLYEMVFG